MKLTRYTEAACVDYMVADPEGEWVPASEALRLAEMYASESARLTDALAKLRKLQPVPLLLRLRVGEEVDLKIIPPQPGFYWVRVKLHLRGQPAGWNPPEVGQLRVGLDGECTWDVCGSEQGLNDGEFEVLSERLTFGGEP